MDRTANHYNYVIKEIYMIKQIQIDLKLYLDKTYLMKLLNYVYIHAQFEFKQSDLCKS